MNELLLFQHCKKTN